MCYHSISNNGWRYSVTSKNFKKQLNFLKKNFKIISLSDLDQFLSGKKEINSPSVVITFDDGYKNILSVIDLFNDIKAKPTIFIISNSSQSNRKELESNLKFLSIKDIKKLTSMGWEIGSHTATHPNMVHLSDSQLFEEIKNSKMTIEKKINRKVRYIAYPKGKYNDNIVDMVKKSGYSLGLTMDDGEINIHTNKFMVPRIGVDGTHSFAEFKYLHYPLLSRLRKLLK